MLKLWFLLYAKYIYIHIYTYIHTHYTMVLSKINSDISYPEIKSINPADLKMEATLYQINVYDVDIVIVAGKMVNTFEQQNVLYFPVYLVKKNGKVTQIGVYEILADQYMNYLDESNDLDVEELEEPLIYTFVTKDMLLNMRMEPPEQEDKIEEKDDVEEEEDMDEDFIEQVEEMDEDFIEELERKPKQFEEEREKPKIPKERDDIFVLLNDIKAPKPLSEETEKKALEIKEKYDASSSENWIQKFMKNNHYSLHNTATNGDCFFDSIRQSFLSIGQQTSVDKLRTKLAEEADETLFMNYKELYDMYKRELVESTQKIKQLNLQYKDLTNKYTNMIDRGEKKAISQTAKEVKEQHDNLVREKKVTAELLNEVKFMDNIETLDDFKQKVRRCDFWGDTWAISTMERILNIKFIVLSSESYNKEDYENIIQCGQLNDNILRNKGIFLPEFYIITEYTGNHYKLIGYRNKQIFTFAELPFDVKMMIANKCMEQNAGVFSLIPDFQRFKDTHKKKSTSREERSVESSELNSAKLRGLYNENVVFMFYHKSNDKLLPGKGSGEKIQEEMLREYKELATLPQWRKKLDNFWVEPFTLDNHKWSSVEHYYQGSKFKKNNPDFYLSFSLDSGTELSKIPEMAKAAGGKSGKYQGELLRPKQVEIDPDFYGGRDNKEIYAAQYAKFSQNDDLKRILIATKNAKLTHYKKGSPAVVFDNLMIIRDKLKRETM